MIAELQTTTAHDGYDAKVLLIQRAFREISRLCFMCDYTLTDEDWQVLDEARLDEPGLSYEELRSRLKALYLRIKRECLRKEAFRIDGSEVSKA